MSPSPLKSIRKKCLDCSCGSYKEVENCVITDCPLYPFRFGTNPKRKGKGRQGGNPELVKLAK